jgi:hypothetical protein
MLQLGPISYPYLAEQFQQKGNNADKARLDIAARGLWSTFERTLTDVRIFNPNSESYSAQTLAQLYIQQENQKKRQYHNRVLQVEKGSFSASAEGIGLLLAHNLVYYYIDMRYN